MSTIVSARFSIPFGELKGPSKREIRVGVIAVLTFITATCLYCLSYQAWVMATTPDLPWTIAIALREWGIWFVLTPVAFRMFATLDTRAAWHRQILAGLALAFVAALVPTIFDQMGDTRSLVSSLALYWPRFVAMTLVIYLLWRSLLRRASAHIEVPLEVSAEVPAATPVPAPVEQPARPETLLVSKGADQCLIRLSDIQHASAAGNYIELTVRDQRYLVRSTMAKLEDLLPSHDYVRIHRSHLVRVDQIERIRTRRSSNGTVHLRSGHTLPLSKTCRAELLRQKVDLPHGTHSSH